MEEAIYLAHIFTFTWALMGELLTVFPLGLSMPPSPWPDSSDILSLLLSSPWIKYGSSPTATLAHEGGALRLPRFGQMKEERCRGVLSGHSLVVWELATEMASLAFWDIQVDDGGARVERRPTTKQSTSICLQMDL